MSEKLQKVLARAGYGSRREIESMIYDGRIRVNGKVKKLGDRVESSHAIKICIDGRAISIHQAKIAFCRVLAYYKPVGEICTYRDPDGRPTVFDRLPKLRGSRWVAVGRLDINTSGLLLFTTDGELANRLMHPSQEVKREYIVRVFGRIDHAKIKNLKQGIQIDNYLAAFSSINVIKSDGVNKWYNVTLSEGRNREVRRLWEAIGAQVNRLIRVRYGNISLPVGLQIGDWVELNLKSINDLRSLVSLNPEVISKMLMENNRFRRKTTQSCHAVKYHARIASNSKSTIPNSEAGKNRNN